MAKQTGLFDEEGKSISVGDILRCVHGYNVVVTEDNDGSFYGKLICEPGHSCENIPYALNKGKDHIVIGRI
jgi:hypothetical protein